jgi:hypothetical protein
MEAPKKQIPISYSVRKKGFGLLNKSPELQCESCAILTGKSRLANPAYSPVITKKK